MNTKKLALIGLSTLSGLFAAFTPMPNLEGDPVVDPSPWKFEVKHLCQASTGTCVYTGTTSNKCGYTSAYITIGEEIYLVSSCYNAQGGDKDDLGKVKHNKSKI